MPRKFLLPLALAVIAYTLLGRPDGAKPELASTRTLDALRQDLKSDSASPLRWADLAEGFARQGLHEQARPCFQRAMELGPKVPPVWIRSINYYVMQSNPDQVLSLSTRVLETVPDYDAILFSYFDQFAFNAGSTAMTLGSSKRAAVSWIDHLIAAGQEARAAEAWDALVELLYTDDALVARYQFFLLNQHNAGRAARVWATHLEERRGDYLRPNLIFNGGFERDPTPSPLDWKIANAGSAEATRDAATFHSGSQALRITFAGTENVSYRQTYQNAWVTPGLHRLRAQIRTEGITTNEGVHLHVTDPYAPALLDVRSESFTGTHAWGPVEVSFVVLPATSLVNVAVCRESSRKFDNKIAGTVWIDDVSLLPLP